MKKTFMATMAVMGMLTFTACSSSDGKQPVQDAAAPAVETVVSTGEGSAADTPETGASETYPEDVQAIIDRGVLRVGVKNAVLGFGYEDPLTGEYTGLEISLAKALADKLGVEVEYTAVTAATRTELLDSGDIDCVLATFTITDERKESWDFSTPYYTDYVSVLVEDSSGIRDLEGLLDKVVGVSSGSTSAKSLVKAMIEEGVIPGDNFDADSFDPAVWTEGVRFQQYDDYPTISTALSAGEVDAFCVDKSILAIYRTEGRSYIEAEFAPQEYGIATTKGSGLSLIADDMIKGFLSDGTIAALISENGLD